MFIQTKVSRPMGFMKFWAKTPTDARIMFDKGPTRATIAVFRGGFLK